MDDQAKVITRDWLITMLGLFLLAGALVTLCFPVYLHSYDEWGTQIKCGTGYSSQLLQATVDDQHARPQYPSATNYTDQCKSALTHRRVLAIAIAGFGVLALVPELLAWARSGSLRSATSTIAEPEEAMHTAALLDRRDRARRARPSDTTL